MDIILIQSAVGRSNHLFLDARQDIRQGGAEFLSEGKRCGAFADQRALECTLVGE